MTVVRHADLASPADCAAIDAFLEVHTDATPFHRRAWIDAVTRGCGHKGHYLITGQSRLTGVLPLHEIHSSLFGRALVSTGFAVGGGILGNDLESVEALGAAAWRLAGETSCPTLELRGGMLPPDWVQDTTTYLNFARELATDDDAELLAIPRKQRAEVRKAFGNDLTVDVGDRAAHYAVYAESVRNLGTPVFPRRLFSAVLDAFGDDADVLTVRKDGVPLASVLSLYHRRVVMPYWGGGTATARATRANDMMYFALMRHGRERGCTRFDFGRSKTGTGAAAFKHNWGFDGVPLAYAKRSVGKAREINPLDPQYSRKVQMWQKLPLAIANRLGPIIARGLGLMGDIAFLVHRLPYPPDRGDRIRSWHVLKALAKLAAVHVYALIDDEADRAHVAMVESVAASVTVVYRRKSKLTAMAEALATGQSASVTAFINKELMAAVAARLPAADTVYAFSSQMAAYVPDDYQGRFVMDFVDMDSAKFAAMGFAGRQEAKRLIAWEIATAKRAKISLFVSDAEASLFKRETGLTAHVMGNGIDLEHFAPDAVPATDTVQPLIVFTGQMDYGPNVEAVVTFAQDALLKIQSFFPDATFAIVGRAPSAAVRALARPSVIVTGEVPDTRPWLAAASVVVAPLLIARGVQNKVLEAMAMGKACVVSRDAAQGIDAIDGHDLVVADDPAAAVIALLQNDAQRAAIGTAARARMAASYCWEAKLQPLAGFVGR